MRDRHSEYYGAFLQEREGRLHGRGQAETLREILEEMDNVRAAWHWAVERGHVEEMGKYVETLWYVGRVRGWHHEVQQALEEGATTLRQRLDLTASQGERLTREQAAVVLADVLSRQADMCRLLGMRDRAITLYGKSLALLRDVPVPGAPAQAEHGAKRDRVRIYAKATLGWLLWISGYSGQGRQLLQEALALADEVGDPWGREFALFYLGTCVRNDGRYSEAEGLLEQAIAIANETGEQWMKAASLDSLSWVLWAKGEYQRAEMLAEESLQIRQELGDHSRIGYSWSRLGYIAKALGNYDLAGQHFQKGLAVANAISHPGMKTDCLIGQATLALALGQHEEAKRLSEESRASAHEAGIFLGETISLVQLGQAACALGETQQARECFCQGLEAAMKAGILFTALDALVGLAYLSAEEGEPEQATELLSLVLHHPTSLQMTKDRAQDLLAELASELASELLAAATARGQARELADVAAEILGENANFPSISSEDRPVATATKTGSPPSATPLQTAV